MGVSEGFEQVRKTFIRAMGGTPETVDELLDQQLTTIGEHQFVTGQIATISGQLTEEDLKGYVARMSTPEAQEERNYLKGQYALLRAGELNFDDGGDPYPNQVELKGRIVQGKPAYPSQVEFAGRLAMRIERDVKHASRVLMQYKTESLPDPTGAVG